VYERVLSTLLNEMDGIEAAGGVITIGATSRVDAVDKVRACPVREYCVAVLHRRRCWCCMQALCRPGRFDEILEIGLPTAVDRRAIFEVRLPHCLVRRHRMRYMLHVCGGAWLQCKLRRVPVGDGVTSELLAGDEWTSGFSGADISALCVEAAMQVCSRICVVSVCVCVQC
jgi:SpoVK/Ycf46/Vps4 family AAA+-type ATPase